MKSPLFIFASFLPFAFSASAKVERIWLTAMQYQFAQEGDPEATKSHGTPVDTQAELFRTTALMP